MSATRLLERYKKLGGMPTPETGAVVMSAELLENFEAFTSGRRATFDPIFPLNTQHPEMDDMYKRAQFGLFEAIGARSLLSDPTIIETDMGAILRVEATETQVRYVGERTNLTAGLPIMSTGLSGIL